MIFTKLFWKDALERAVKTLAQTFIAVVGVAAPASGTDLMNVNYIPILLTSLLAAGISIVTSVASAAKAGTDTASLVVDTKELK